MIRDGRLQEVPADDLVPGDLIALEAGDRVPADVAAHPAPWDFRVADAVLTGESVPVDKDHRECLIEHAPLGDRVNMVYMGTTVAAGTARGVVVATGMNTEMGRIAGMLQPQRTGADAAPAAARRAGPKV